MIPMSQIGDVVVVVDCHSLPKRLLGRYGIITDVTSYKITVKFNERVGQVGSFSHTCFTHDIRKVGEITDEEDFST
jgi:hypothetical protein